MAAVLQGKAKVVSNQKVAPEHYVIRLEAPLAAKLARPGQFVQIQSDEGIEPFLRRPFSLLDVSGAAMDILYAVVGKGTQLLAKKRKGDFVDVLGPLGNGWTPLGAKKRAILVGGGVGIPPLYFFAKQEKSHLRQIEVFLGARSKSLLLCQRDFQKLGVNVHVATDDGSAGFKGHVTDLVKKWMRTRANYESRYLYACGPTPMLKAVAQVAHEFHLDGEVSMEAPMACGFGICVGCAIPVVGGGYKLCCYHGTVFKMREVAWEGMA